MKVYTVIVKYNGYDEYPDKYIGTFDSLETVIEKHGMDLDYMNKSWGSMAGYIEWLDDTEKDYQTKYNFDGHTCYIMAGEGCGYQLYVYEAELIGKMEHKFIS